MRIYFYSLTISHVYIGEIWASPFYFRDLQIIIVLI